MNRIGRAAVVAAIHVGALGAVPAGAVTIANPTNTYSSPNLSGELTGGNQTQYFGETFTAPITGSLTNFQFTLNSSTLALVYGVVFGWDGSKPTTELYRSAVRPGTAGLFNFSPTGVQLTQGQTYVAFISTYGIANNSGLATVATCLPFGGCNSNNIPNLGTLIFGNVQGSGLIFNPVVNNSQDATFSVTIAEAAVPEPATWAMMMAGMGAVGLAMRRRRAVATRVSYAL